MTTHEDAVSTSQATPATAGPRLEMLTSPCGGGTCPTVYSTDRESVIVQGYITNAESVGVEVPDGERLVEIPVEVLLAAADRIRERA